MKHSHPFVQYLKNSPPSDFVKTLFTLCKKPLNKLFPELGDLNADFAEISILQALVYSTTAISNQRPVTKRDHELYGILTNAYNILVDRLVHRHPGQNFYATLALHRIFIEKLEAYQNRPDSATRNILYGCNEMLKALRLTQACKPKLQEIIDGMPSGKFKEFALAIRDENFEAIKPYASDAILEPEHPFVTELILAPQTPFVSNLLRLYEKQLNEASETENSFIIASAFQTIFCSALSGCLAIKYQPQTDQDQGLFTSLSWRYYAEVNKLKHKANLGHLELSALALHAYFSQKHAIYLNHKNLLMSEKLSIATQLQSIIADRMRGIKPFRSRIDKIMDFHAQLCKREGAPEGQLGYLARIIRAGKIRSHELLTLENAVGVMDPESIRTYIDQKAAALNWSDICQKRWLNQLADHRHQPEYYQAWTKHNPYEHARSLAYKTSAKYTMAMLLLATTISLIVAGATGGIGGFLALNTAASFLETMPGLYVLGIAGTTFVSAPLSYMYNKKECTFKQQAIEECVRFEPTNLRESMS